ncbi:hypothetical protein MAR_016767 [Mya arenaria]|uniref:DDE-1 domain-containing protein n=1 Tax=Mya arenaria TaxID=6604 RepID=A0ABY7ECB6_MYAAR|nr:uncharacterized protein LOC128237371 isoform X1 [Mya arenaria]WAR06809.1 hypothetical protein MAR_016767 [Mya arenaria]
MAEDEKFDGVLLNMATQLEGGVPQRRGSGKKKYRAYSDADIQRAYYLVTQKQMAVQRAADMCGVPESTLRDRVKGKVKQVWVKSGPPPVLAMEEEGRLVEYLHLMCSFGYSYSRTDIINMASDFAIILGKREPSDGLTHQWYYKCLERWPGLDINRASSVKKQIERATSVDCLSKYFVSLQELLNKYNLNNKPDSIFIIDEVMIELNKRMPYVSSWKGYIKLEKYNKRNILPPAMTIIASGNASGARLPAFFIFQGKTVSSESIEDCSPGTGATCSDDGLTNCNVFQLYLENHFLKFIERKDDGEAILVLYDGHRTHMSPDLVQMYKSQNVHLFPIPPSGSQCLVEMDKGVFGNMDKVFDRECEIFQETEIDRDLHENICVVASKAYNESVNAENLKNAFKRFGLWPFKPQIVNKRIDLNRAPPEPPSVKGDRMMSISTTVKRTLRRASKRPLKKSVDLENMEELESHLVSARKKKRMLPTKRLNYSGRKPSEQFLAKKRAKEQEKKSALKMKFLRDIGGSSKKGKGRKKMKIERHSESEYETDSDYEIDEMLSSEEEEQEDSVNRRESAQRTVELAIQREHFESALRNELLSTHGLYFEGSQRERFEQEFEKVKNDMEDKEQESQEDVEEEEVIEEAVLDQNQVTAQIVDIHSVSVDGTSLQQNNGTITQIILTGVESVEPNSNKADTVVYTEEASTSGEKIETGPTVVIENVLEEIIQTEKCCVCNKEHPDSVRDGYVVEFCTWGKCDYQDCDHWTHLKYCCDVKVLRRHDIFYCPCHNKV